MGEPESALTSFIDELHADYEVWYAKATRRAYRWYLMMQCVAVLSGFLSSIIAAFADQDDFGRWAKPTLIVLPLIGGLAATVIVQTKLYDMWRLREDARIQFQGLVTEGRQRLAAAKSDDDLSKIHEDLQKRSQDLEKQQAASFFGFFASDYVVQYKKPGP